MTGTTHSAAVISLPRSQVEMTDWEAPRETTPFEPALALVSARYVQKGVLNGASWRPNRNAFAAKRRPLADARGSESGFRESDGASGQHALGPTI